MSETEYLSAFEQFDPPFEDFTDEQLGADFPAELETTSRMWISTGYRQGILAYLNFFLLKDFIVTHDTAYKPRFLNFKAMADSFYQTDLFVRDVTDSGKTGTGGISSPEVRKQLRGIMARHTKLSIPLWMMSYFGFQLMEAVEQECPDLNETDRQHHLNYFSKTYRIMGLPFSSNRKLMEQFARSIESAHAGSSTHLERHCRNILALGEMVGVSSDYESLASKLPVATREIFAPIHPKTRPGPFKRPFLRIAGRILVKRAIGDPARKAVPFALIK